MPKKTTRKTPVKIDRLKITELISEHEKKSNRLPQPSDAGAITTAYMQTLDKRKRAPRRQSVYNLTRKMLTARAETDAPSVKAPSPNDSPYITPRKPLKGPFGGVPPYAKKEEDDAEHLYDPIIINLRSRIAHHEHVISDLKNALRLIIKHK